MDHIKTSVMQTEDDFYFKELERKLADKSLREKRVTRLQGKEPFARNEDGNNAVVAAFPEDREKIKLEYNELLHFIAEVPALSFLQERVSKTAATAVDSDALIGFYRIVASTLKSENDKCLKTNKTKNEKEAAEQKRELETSKEIRDLENLIAEKDKEIFLFRENVVKRDKQIAHMQEMYDKLKFDFDKYRERFQKDMEAQTDKSFGELILKLLPVVDNFERAFSSAKTSKDEHSISNGVEMVLNQFYNILEQTGVERVKALNEPFNPNLHEALMIEVKPDIDENTVIEEFSKGYTFKSKLLRPTAVKVSKKS